MDSRKCSFEFINKTADCTICTSINSSLISRNKSCLNYLNRSTITVVNDQLQNSGFDSPGTNHHYIKVVKSVQVSWLLEHVLYHLCMVWNEYTDVLYSILCVLYLYVYLTICVCLLINVRCFRRQNFLSDHNVWGKHRNAKSKQHID